MNLPRLHIVTSSEVLAAADFTRRATAVLERLGPRVALHLRAHDLPGRLLYERAAVIAPVALHNGAWLLLNDRIDVALSVRATGVQLGIRSLPVAVARRLVGSAPVGCSVHTETATARAEADGADFVILGTIYPSRSHPGAAVSGIARVRAAVMQCDVPVIAIGGITVARVPELVAAGAHGVAVLSGVWSSPAAPAAAAAYDEALPVGNETATGRVVRDDRSTVER